MSSELNSRQWALYNYLKERGDQWTFQVDICNDLKSYYGCWYGEKFDFHNTTARMRLTADIRAINDSHIIQKVIISTSKGVKIANKEEFERYISKEIKAAIRRLLRAKRKADKGNKDRQMRFVFNSERDTIEAFIDSKPIYEGEEVK